MYYNSFKKNIINNNIIILFYFTLLGMLLLSNSFVAGIFFILPPLILISKIYRKIIFYFIIILLLKAIISYILPFDDDDYYYYEFNLEWLIRELFTIIIILSYFFIGLKIFNWKFFTEKLNPAHFLFIYTSVITFRYITIDNPFLSGVDSGQFIVLFIFFLLSNVRYYGFFWYAVGLILSIISLGTISSSFTVIAIGIIIFCGALSILKIGEFLVPMKLIVFITVIFLCSASFIASQVHLRGTRESGEGNNGPTREILADSALQTFLKNPLVGTSFGKGIVPVPVVKYTLGWKQYFDDDFKDEFNLYALSFHNGFLYIITRFGIFSLVILFFLIKITPSYGKLNIVLFLTVAFLSISANVVVESIRAGPGVALVLGALFNGASFKKTGSSLINKRS